MVLTSSSNPGDPPQTPQLSQSPNLLYEVSLSVVQKLFNTPSVVSQEKLSSMQVHIHHVPGRGELRVFQCHRLTPALLMNCSLTFA